MDAEWVGGVRGVVGCIMRSTTPPCSHCTVTDMKPQNVSHSVKARCLQQIKAVKAKHKKLSISSGV